MRESERFKRDLMLALARRAAILRKIREYHSRVTMPHARAKHERAEAHAGRMSSLKLAKLLEPYRIENGRSFRLRNCVADNWRR